jgi:hypothetical protein
MQRRTVTVPANLAHPALAHEHLKSQAAQPQTTGGGGAASSSPSSSSSAASGSAPVARPDTLAHSSEATYAPGEQQSPHGGHDDSAAGKGGGLAGPEAGLLQLQFHSERDPATYANVPRELEKQLRLQGTTFASQDELEAYVAAWSSRQEAEERARSQSLAAEQRNTEMCKKQEAERQSSRAAEKAKVAEELEKEVAEKVGEKEKDTARRETIAEEERRHADELRSRYRR